MEIRKHKYDFNFRKYWFNDSKLLTYFANANSLIIELAEELFTNVIKTTRNKIKDDILRYELDILLAQESWHKYNHAAFNSHIKKTYFLDDAVKDLRTSLLKYSTKIKKQENRVLICSSFERIAGRTSTYITCKLLNNSDKVVKDFWEWHRLEENEHKSTVVNFNKYFNKSTLKAVVYDFYFLIWYFKYLLKLAYVQFKQDTKNAAY